MTVTGKTGENIVLSGKYRCEEHNDVEKDLIKDDTFPHCERSDGHTTTWVLIEDEDEIILPSLDIFTDRKKELKETYNELGFSEGKMGTPLADVLNRIKGETEAAKDARKQETGDRLASILNESQEITRLINEKLGKKTEFSTELNTYKNEYDALYGEVKQLYQDLTAAMIEFGEEKEDIILKRAAKFKEEMDAITNIYQELEDKENKQFDKLATERKYDKNEKAFYESYRDGLIESFEKIKRSINVLESSGFTSTISKFLVNTGWLAAFAGSWFFMMWYAASTGNNYLSNVGILTHILEGIRLFIIKTRYWSLLALPVYIAAVFVMSLICYWLMIKAGFINRKKNKEENDNGNKDDDNDDQIEFDLSKEGLIKTRFKAKNWYELWLKLIPYLTAAFLLFFVITAGHNITDLSFSNGDGKNLDDIFLAKQKPPIGDSILANTLQAQNYNGDYPTLSEAITTQGIGILFPFALTILFFLHITKVIEAERSDGKRRKWYEPVSLFTALALLTLFTILLCLPLIDGFSSAFTNNSKTGTVNKVAILNGAAGFLLSSICACVALSYGYRYLTLRDASADIAKNIDRTNKYIRQLYYPLQLSYARFATVVGKKKSLYDSLLEMMGLRNGLSEAFIDPVHRRHREYMHKFHEWQKKQQAEQKKNRNAANKKTHSENAATTDTQAEDQEPKGKSIFDAVFNVLKRNANEREKEKRAYEKKIDGLEEENYKLKNDKVDKDDVLYFPAKTARIQELKLEIDRKEKMIRELKIELLGYYRKDDPYDNSTYRKIEDELYGLNKQLRALEDKKSDLKNELQQWLEYLDKEHKNKLHYTEDGYRIGVWFKANKDND